MVVWWSLTKPEKGTMIAKVPASIYALSYDSKSDELIVGQNFDGIHIIRVQDRREVGSLSLTEAAIFDIQRDGNLIYIGTGAGELIVVDRSSMQILKRIKLSEKSARTIAFSDEEVFVGYSDNQIRIFEKGRFDHIDTLEGHKISVFSLQYDKERDLLISGSRDASLKFWNLKNRTLDESIAAHMFAINHISYSPDRRYFVSCSMDKAIKVWDAESRKLLKVIDKSRHAGHGTSVNKLLWMDYNDLLVSCSDDRSISVWDIKFEE